MSQVRSLSRRFPETPFRALVGHFVRRLFAADEEQTEGGMNFGLGAVLAILASPGAFATIFLLDKYSSLLQWLRGQHFDPYRASVTDEYFFVVLSMTITGLVMVLRWNRLFPDRRDFANLAVLPIPIRNIFLANFTALLGLGVLLGIDVNAVSSLLFPLIVTLSDGSVSAFFRIGMAHWAAVLSASMFSFFGVFALVGILMLVLPKRLFRPVSLLIRMLLVVGLLTEFFSDLFVQLFLGRLPNQATALVRLVPSFWFLGVYENVAKLAKPEMAHLGHQALAVLLALIVLSLMTYVLCYGRHFLRLAESLESLGGAQRWFRPSIPEWISKVLFRSPFEHACFSFGLKVLVRSERHLMFFGGYLGIGLVLVAQTALDAAKGNTGVSIPNPDLLSLPLLIAFFAVTGLRFAFDMPAELSANWVFRATVQNPQPPPDLVARRLTLAIVLPCEVLLMMPLMARSYGWAVAAMHTVTVVALTVVFIYVVLIKFHKIPFTCSTQRDVKQRLARILGSVFGVMVAVPMLAAIEHWMLLEPARFFVGIVMLAIVCFWMHRYRREMLPQDRILTFEDGAPQAFELLRLAS
jgi:hypothetical protein